VTKGSYIALEVASPEIGEAYEMLKGKPDRVLKMLADRPNMRKAFVAFYASVGHALDRRRYQIVYIRVSMIKERR
jgi:hypothetical protein